MISTKKDCMYSNNSDVGTGEQGGMPPPLSMGGGGHRMVCLPTLFRAE